MRSANTLPLLKVIANKRESHFFMLSFSKELN
jgi:hypothetical protein